MIFSAKINGRGTTTCCTNKILQNIKKSESKAMYIMGYGVRQTYHIDDLLNRLKMDYDQLCFIADIYGPLHD